MTYMVGSRYRLALCLGLVAATLAGPLAGAALAADRDHGDRDRGRGERDRDRGQRGDRGEWRQGYYRRPDVYYSAPPVVAPPYGYYQQPGASLTLSLPFR